MFYGKYEEDEPSLAHKIARELSKRSDDDDVRMTARYCNSGDTDDYGYGKTKTPKSDKVKVSIKFDKLKVGDTIKGLEHLGAIVSISGPETTPEKVEDRFTAKKINKIRKWLDKKGFEFDGEYKGQISYWKVVSLKTSRLTKLP